MFRKQTILETWELVTKFYKEGKSLCEIASIIGQNDNAVKKIYIKWSKQGDWKINQVLEGWSDSLQKKYASWQKRLGKTQLPVRWIYHRGSEAQEQKLAPVQLDGRYMIMVCLERF